MRTAFILLVLLSTIGCQDILEKPSPEKKWEGNRINAKNIQVPFKSFEVSSQSDEGLKFHFSGGDASSESPIIITVVGRPLTESDRKHRVSLQKHWISVNVPSEFKFISRSLVFCSYKREGEFSGCDLYVFKNPKTNESFEFFFYLGHWPCEDKN